MAVKRLAVKTKAPLGTEEKVDSTLIKTEEVKTESTPTFTRKLGIQKGIVVNMGNYESARVTIWQERYCADDKLSANKVMAEMSQEIEDLLEAEVNALKG